MPISYRLPRQPQIDSSDSRCPILTAMSHDRNAALLLTHARCVVLCLVLVEALSAHAAALQKVRPAAPGAAGDPQWQRVVHLSDGRTFVSDGGLALDAAIAKPRALPSSVLGPAGVKVLEGYMAAPLRQPPITPPVITTPLRKC